MISRKAIKENAKFQLGGNIFSNNWLMGVVVMLIVGAIMSFLAPSGVGTIIVTGPLVVGSAFVFMNLLRTGNSIKIEDVFKKGFTECFGRNVILYLLIGIFTFLWSMLLIIPGIVAAYSYSMAPYIANDHPEYDWRQCIEASKKLTYGHKAELFMLDLSFIGWFFVGALCFGIGTIWVSVYQEAARANYYEALLGLPRANG